MEGSVLLGSFHGRLWKIITEDYGRLSGREPMRLCVRAPRLRRRRSIKR